MIEQKDYNDIITREAVAASLKKAVAERGADYVYERREVPDPFEEGELNRACVYQYDGKPDCIVGYVLDDLGIPYSPSWEGASARYVLKALRVNDANLVLDLTDVQRFQDSGIPWGEAIKDF